MKRTSYGCDRCQAEIGPFAPEISSHIEKLGLVKGDIRQGQDLCHICYQELEAWWPLWRKRT